MKIFRLLFLIFLVGLISFASAVTRSKSPLPYLTKDAKKQLRITIHNGTGVNLEEVSATFRFLGTNELGQQFIDGTVKINDLKKNTSAFLDSKDALYHEKSAESFFKPIKGNKKLKIANVELIKLSAGRWKLKGTNFKIRSARIAFKPGTHKINFVIRIKKNRFGFPSYVIEELASGAEFIK